MYLRYVCGFVINGCLSLLKGCTAFIKYSKRNLEQGCERGAVIYADSRY